MSAVTDERTRAVEGHVASITGRVLRLWGQVDPQNIAASWSELSTDAYALVSLGQLAAASGADAYTDAAWTEAHGGPAVSLGAVQPRALAGVASDGRDLLSLLRLPTITALTSIGRGMPTTDALVGAGHSLAVIAATQVSDAGRAAETVAMTARPRIVGYTRVLSTPSCSRCAILAGKWFRYNEGFLRHPRCDCRHMPSDEPEAPLTAPRDYFDSLTRAQQDRYFGKADAEAIRAGRTDPISAVNARRKDRRVVGVRAATAGRAKPPQKFTVVDSSAHSRMQDAFRRAAAAAMSGDRALAEQIRAEARALADAAYGRAAQAGRPQAMPEQLVAAAPSRAEAIEALVVHGYVA